VVTLGEDVNDPQSFLEAQRHEALHYKLDRILRRLAEIEIQLGRIMTVVDDLKAIVSNNTTVIGSALALIQGFATQLATITAELAAAGVDVTALKALGDQITADDKSLAAAVAANTPAANTPAAPPVPVVPPVVPAP
jgi:hypothetical protein